MDRDLARDAAAAPRRPVSMPGTYVKISLDRPDQPDCVSLLTELYGYLIALYPQGSIHRLDAVLLARSDVRFAVARDADDRAVGCAASVLRGKDAELKQMYVRPEARNQSVGKRLLQFLESRSLEAGCTRMMLETGTRKPEALRLYERCGFVRRAPFGEYTEDPLSVFMEKALTRP